jgi:hypothetical protein
MIMVTIEEIQAAYYMVAATGVLVAAAYYVMNLRANQRNTKTQLSSRIADKLATKDFLDDLHYTLLLDWRDVNDFRERYDHAINRESFVRRFSIWETYDNLGFQVRKGLVDPRIVFDAAGWHCVMIWARYKPVIEEVSRPELGPRAWENFEYLANVMWRIAKERGAVSIDGRGGSQYEIYRRVFEKT